MWDGTGLCIYAKRLEQGRFACLWRNAAACTVPLTMSELQLFLEGSALVGRVALSAPIRADEERVLSWTPKLPIGDYVVRVRLIYDLNRDNGPKYGHLSDCSRNQDRKVTDAKGPRMLRASTGDRDVDTATT